MFISASANLPLMNSCQWKSECGCRFRETFTTRIGPVDWKLLVGEHSCLNAVFVLAGFEKICSWQKVVSFPFLSSIHIIFKRGFVGLSLTIELFKIYLFICLFLKSNPTWPVIANLYQDHGAKSNNCLYKYYSGFSIQQRVWQVEKNNTIVEESYDPQKNGHPKVNILHIDVYPK